MKKLNKKLLILILPILIFSFLIQCDKSPFKPGDEKWKAFDMGRVTKGTNDRCRGQILFADLRQDGISRLYCLVRVNIYSVIYEFSYSNNSWTKTRIDYDGLRIHSIAIGRCKNDGIQRLYGVSSDVLYEFNFNNGQWSVLEICSFQDIKSPQAGQDLAIGDPRKDGFESLYVLGYSGLYETSCRNMVWESSFIDTVKDIEDITVGNGRRDNNQQIYLINSNTDLFEYKFENGSWQKSVIGELIAPTNAYAIVEVLNAHNGLPAVYASMAKTGGLPFEFFYDNGQWTKTSIGDEPGINQIHCGIGRNDGVHRIYSAENFDILAEFTYFGGSSSKSSETKTDENTALTAVAVVPGRGDGINRVYVLQFVGHLFEFTYKK